MAVASFAVPSAQRQGLLCEEEENSEDDEVCIIALVSIYSICVCMAISKGETDLRNTLI